MSLESLYTDIILDHYRSPRQFGELEEVDLSVEGNNPLCGDELKLFLQFDGETVEKARWQGQGCAISQASTSMMADMLEGKTVEELREVALQFRSMMQDELDEEEIEELGDLQAIQGVVKFPIRIKCAVLPWNTLQEALLNRHKDVENLTYEEEMEEDEVPDQIPGQI